MRKLWLRLLHKLTEIHTGHDVVILYCDGMVISSGHSSPCKGTWPTMQLTVYKTTNFQIQNFLKSSKSLLIIHTVVRKRGEFAIDY